ncbi:unnamed protein product [Thelazia callipaeda]|uniref:YTH domain-containing protein n=1 Tax=Thelazia callipaeda TaxID=103827 RepID=A0A0N5CYV9_THECL|nr:unnamed protein product [Thelazia callipaeda]
MSRAQFFLARSCEENIRLAIKTSFWTTHPLTERLLTEAFRRAPILILIFLAQNADHFAGFAQMCSEAQYNIQPEIRWVNFRGGGNIKLFWISKCALDIRATDHIKNPFNKEKVIYAAADGCEIQCAAGQQLCSLFPYDARIDLNILKMKIQHISPRAKSSLPSLLDTKISYIKFRNAKRNLALRKTWKNLCSEERLPLILSPITSLHNWRDRRDEIVKSNNSTRLLPLMDIKVSHRRARGMHLSSLWGRHRYDPLRQSPKHCTSSGDIRIAVNTERSPYENLMDANNFDDENSFHMDTYNNETCMLCSSSTKYRYQCVVSNPFSCCLDIVLLRHAEVMQNHDWSCRK